MSQLDHRLWKVTRQAIDRQARGLVRRDGRLPRAVDCDALIAKLYFWSVLHDRPMGWAADRDHVGGHLFRPRRIPSRSQLARRIGSDRFRRLLNLIHQDLAGALDPDDGGFFDGKPLTVSPVSKDPDAKRGHVTGGFAKGYKLHLWATSDRRIALWSIMPLNAGEPLVAKALCDCLPTFNNRAMTLADGNYDSWRLYQALAEKNGALLVKPRGLDLKDPATWQQAQKQLHPKNKTGGPAREAGLKIWKNAPELGRYVYGRRIEVEGILSNLTSFGGGLASLPAWVRTLPRVTRWVGAKIILYHARLQARGSMRTAV